MTFLGIIAFKSIYGIIFLIVYKQGSYTKTITQIAFCGLTFHNNFCLQVFGSELHV